MQYEYRLILFIDFLGFKEHVDRTVEDPSHLTELTDAIKDLRFVTMEQEVFATQRMTHFSDSIALSYRIDETSAVFWMLSQIALAIMSLAAKGFLVRGAVTVGLLMHTDEVLVGPALVDAYHMESKVAFYPRVLVDPKVIEVAREFRREGHEPDEEERYVRETLAEDELGHLWIDYVSYKAVQETTGEDPLDYPPYLESIGSLVETGLSHLDPRVLRKYLWLHRHYTDAIDLFGSAPQQDDYEMESVRLAVANLPTFAEKALSAQAAVDAAASNSATSA